MLLDVSAVLYTCCTDYTTAKLLLKTALIADKHILVGSNIYEYLFNATLKPASDQQAQHTGWYFRPGSCPLLPYMDQEQDAPYTHCHDTQGVLSLSNPLLTRDYLGGGDDTLSALC